MNVENLRDLDYIQFGLLSAEEIVRQSVCEVSHLKLTGPNSVYDDRMGTLDANINPLRSKMRPRLAGISSCLSKRTVPCLMKKALPTTCTYTARTTKPMKPKAIQATIN
jgi:hypothetical protein